jgi:hypothetical protein
MVPKIVKRRMRPLWIAGLLSAGWANRADVRRWLAFSQRTWSEREKRSMSEVLTEARARAAITMDPVLRRDRSLKDIVVDDGVVTLLTTSQPWPDGSAHISRVKQVRGITDVITRNAAESPANHVS